MALFTRIRGRVLSVSCGLMILGSAATPYAAIAQASPGFGHSAASVQYVMSQPSAFIAPRRDDTAMTITMLQVGAAAGGSSEHTLRNALIGAVIGGAVLGGITAIHAAHCEDCFFQGPIVAIAAGAGAGLGALIGSAVSSNIEHVH